MTDLIRYPVGIAGGLLTLWCTDCADPTNPLPPTPIWTEADAAEQVTELCLANLVAIAEEHEQQHHDDEPYADLTLRDVDPDAVHATEDDDYDDERAEAYSTEAPF